MSRWENQIQKKEQSAIRRLFVERFISSYEKAPEDIVLDIDGWDDPTYGNQQLSFFHGYYRYLNKKKSKNSLRCLFNNFFTLNERNYPSGNAPLL